MSPVASPPAPPAARDDALGRLLGEVAISIRSQRRLRPTTAETVALGADGLSLVYVIAGHIDLPAGAGLPDALTAGDALLATGARALTAFVPAGSAALVSHLNLADSAAHLADLLPDVGWIRGFAQLEPAAAALAQHLGVEETACTREGDLVICRMMATTLLQSVIRAWSSMGCAPQGWPSRSRDPFLDRVADAIADDPGREWTVEQMASASALSRSVFTERFRRAFGVSPAQYVAEVRMRAARALLVDGRGVSEVSRELGYSSDEGFSRAFRRHTGLTPSAWRAHRLPAHA
ncbi:helix-turn-helix transcriptional regulator [Microbacterium sp. NPDC058342]|uniref:helix-turn-helix transcriptional regulator n=1 Tax=Microbacterium sp. NPDC058342 TaxID=3346454 RepID=UPI00365CA393